MKKEHLPMGELVFYCLMAFFPPFMLRKKGHMV